MYAPFIPKDYLKLNCSLRKQQHQCLWNLQGIHKIPMFLLCAGRHNADYDQSLPTIIMAAPLP